MSQETNNIFQELKENIEAAKVRILFNGEEKSGGHSSGMDADNFYIVSPENKIIGNISLGDTENYVEYKDTTLRNTNDGKETDLFNMTVREACKRDDSLSQEVEKLPSDVLSHWVKGKSYTREDFICHIQVNLLLENDFESIEKAACVNWDRHLAENDSVCFDDGYMEISNPFIDESGRFPLTFEKSLETYGESNVYLYLYDLIKKYDLPLLFEDPELKNTNENKRFPVIYNDEKPKENETFKKSKGEERT